MDTSLPTGRSGRLAALGITVIILGMLWFLCISPLIGVYQGRDEQVRHQTVLAAHMSVLAAALPNLREQAAASKQATPTRLTIDGSSDAVAAAALQSLLQEMASSTGANLSSIENVPAETTGAYRRIGLKITFDAPWTVLVNLLAAIDKSAPPMLVDNLEIHASPVHPANQAITLDIGLNVYALRAATGEGAPS